MSAGDFIMTIESDSDFDDLPPTKNLKSTKSQNLDPEDAQLNTELTFDLAGDPYADIIGESNLRDLVKKGSRPVCMFSSIPDAPIDHVFSPRNRSPSTTSSRDGNCRRILGNANEMLMNSGRMNRVRKKTGPAMKTRTA
jgi:hypothetical protein